MMSTIVLFIAILGFLVLVHEGGHFLAAKRSGVRVHEFALGFPPRLFSRKRGETVYSVNLLPIGGFVRIEGEDGGGEGDPARSFTGQPLSRKLNMLLAGVAINWFVAAGILGVLQTVGVPVSIPDTDGRSDARVVIAQVQNASPAEDAGITSGDTIAELRVGDEVVIPERISEAQEFLRTHAGEEVRMVLLRGEESLTVTATPRREPPPGQGALGVVLLRVATIAHPWYEAPWRGVFLASSLTVSFVHSFSTIGYELFTQGKLAEGIAGPVGIAALTGDAKRLGALFVLNFIAMLSLNLAILNALPFPALDGGRAAVALFEHAIRRPVPARVLAYLNSAGLAVLMLVVVALTVHDVRNLL